ncbi:MAG: hypothetical protein JSW60_00245 [Thermoplasmatales archaeon]|nr:MAG: hypothetical protein JSW60_00245 [Thermoplasmatales archaeon]
MKKQAMVVLIFIILILTIVLPASGNDDSDRVEKVLNQNVKFHTSKVILFGIIKEMQSGNMTSFTTVHVFCITINNYNGTKIPVMNLSKNSEMDFNMKLYQFRGILLKHFICGIFKFPKVSASPGSMPFGLPAELEITVAANGIGLNHILVNISIPGISGEMSTHTNANGKSLFAFTPPSTGEIKIEIENKRIPLTVEITV